jgi:hypothetical protein
MYQNLAILPAVFAILSRFLADFAISSGTVAMMLRE